MKKMKTVLTIVLLVYLLKCRKEFGEQTWACPGSRW